MIQNLGNRMEKIQETFNKYLEEQKNKQTVINNTITESKNSPEGNNSRKTEAEEQISELEDKNVEITASARMKRIEDSLRDFLDNIKCTNIQIIEGPRRKREKERG